MHVVSSLVGLLPTAIVVAQRLGDELVTRLRMDDLHPFWQQKLQKSSKLENAIAVSGFKAALIIGISDLGRIWRRVQWACAQGPTN